MGSAMASNLCVRVSVQGVEEYLRSDAPHSAPSRDYKVW